MEQKSAGTAGRVEHSVLERVCDCCLNDLLCEPIWCVVLAEVFARSRRDDALIEHLQNVVFNIAPSEPREPPCQRSDEVLTTLDVEYPVEEVGVHHATDLRLGEQCA